MSAAALIALRIGNTRQAAPLVMVNAESVADGGTRPGAGDVVTGSQADSRYAGE
jgi:hypothetical protein